jgi:hypothetical protein
MIRDIGKCPQTRKEHLQWMSSDRRPRARNKLRTPGTKGLWSLRKYGRANSVLCFGTRNNGSQTLWGRGFFFNFLRVGRDWVHLVRRPLINCSIVPDPDDRLWMWSSRWNENWQVKPKYSEKTCPSATLLTTNPTRPDLGSNRGRRGGKPATNRLSYGAASKGIIPLAQKWAFAHGYGCYYCQILRMRFFMTWHLYQDLPLTFLSSRQRCRTDRCQFTYIASCSFPFSFLTSKALKFLFFVVRPLPSFQLKSLSRLIALIDQ